MITRKLASQIGASLEKINKPRRSTIAIVSICFSGLAIVISAFSLYTQFFYVISDGSATLVDAHWTGDSTILCKFIFYNTGNRFTTIITNTFIMQNYNRSKLMFSTYDFEVVSEKDSFRSQADPKQIFIPAGQQAAFETQVKYKSRTQSESDTLLIYDIVEYLTGSNKIQSSWIYLGYLIFDGKSKKPFFRPNLMILQKLIDDKGEIFPATLPDGYNSVIFQFHGFPKRKPGNP